MERFSALRGDLPDQEIMPVFGASAKPSDAPKRRGGAHPEMIGAREPGGRCSERSDRYGNKENDHGCCRGHQTGA